MLRLLLSQSADCDIAGCLSSWKSAGGNRQTSVSSETSDYHHRVFDGSRENRMREARIIPVWVLMAVSKKSKKVFCRRVKNTPAELGCHSLMAAGGAPAERRRRV